MQVDGNRFRRSRFALFLQLVDTVARKEGPVRILDIGGRASYWEALRPLWRGRDFDITLVNVEPLDESLPGYRCHQGNACAMPEFPDMHFDIVHSNSVIEHVGRWQDMQTMAREVRRLAPGYYVQTPDFAFPVEPHFRTPFFHWLPETMRASLLTGRSLGFRSAGHFAQAMEQVQDVNLLSLRQMKTLFPDARIRRERLLLLPKSLIAIRDRPAV